MATYRYSGSLRIRLAYSDVDCGYICTIKSVYSRVVRGTESRRVEGVFVGEAACLTCAVDSPEAFDDAARAALAYASADAQACAAGTLNHGASFHVGRKPQDAYPPHASATA